MTAVEARGTIPDSVIDDALPGRARPGVVRLAAALVELIRPRQWVKNLVAVPLALAVAPQWTVDVTWRAAWATLMFTLASGLVYVLNDIADRKLDREHPVKSHRPIASGRVSVTLAWFYAAALAGLLAGSVAAGPPMAWWPLWGYLVVNAAYSRWLKHVPLVDICVVAAGFVLRVLQGYQATGGRASGWLLTAVFTVCLVLIVGKRRHELASAGAIHRPALRGYNLALADHLLGLNSSLAILTFLLFLNFDAPFGPHRDLVLAAAVPLILYGVFRYLQAVLVLRLGGDPLRTVLRDRLILSAAALLAATIGAALVVAHLPNT